MSRYPVSDNAPERCVAATVRCLKKEEGTNLMEYGLVAILFMTLMFGLMGLGQMVYAYHYVAHAAKSAARWAAVNGETCASDSSCSAPASSSDIATYVTNSTPQGIDSTQVTVNSSWPVLTSSPTICSAAATIPNGSGSTTLGPYPNYPGCTVEVQVSYKFNWFFPLGSSSSVTMSSSSEMVISH